MTIRALLVPAVSGQGIAGQYIVTLKPGVSIGATVSEHGIKTMYRYGRVLNGFAAKFTSRKLAKLRRAAGVARTDQTAPPLSRSHTYNSTGAGVYAYVIGTGISAADDLADSGVLLAVAAGNDSRNACDHSPGSAANSTTVAANGTTVAASTITDARASYGNYGARVDLVRAGIVHHLDLTQRRDEHHQRHLDGHPARHRRRRPLQGHLRRRLLRHHPQQARRQRRQRCDQRQPGRDAEPPARQAPAPTRLAAVIRCAARPGIGTRFGEGRGRRL